MEIVIQKNGITGVDVSGKVYKINHLIVPKQKGGQNIYDPKDTFFKAACPPGTKHQCTLIDGTYVNIY